MHSINVSVAVRDDRVCKGKDGVVGCVVRNYV